MQRKENLKRSLVKFSAYGISEVSINFEQYLVPFKSDCYKNVSSILTEVMIIRKVILQSTSGDAATCVVIKSCKPL